jgi:hypothetical protein
MFRSTAVSVSQGRHFSSSLYQLGDNCADWLTTFACGPFSQVTWALSRLSGWKWNGMPFPSSSSFYRPSRPSMALIRPPPPPPPPDKVSLFRTSALLFDCLGTRSVWPMTELEGKARQADRGAHMKQFRSIIGDQGYRL